MVLDRNMVSIAEQNKNERLVTYGFEHVPPGEKTARVGEIFNRVAPRYDLMNDAMSGGLHRLWKDRFVARARPRAGEAIVDVAGGTGDIAFRLARSGAHVTVADINGAMLEVGMARAAKRGLTGLVWAEENAERLSFPDRSYDAYTAAFGLRNFTDLPAALAEAWRVLKWGGRFYCLEFSTTEWPGFGQLYDAYSLNIIPRLGGLIARDRASYQYLVESIRRFPDMPAFAQMIEAAGFARVGYTPILGGAVAIHHGWKV